MIKESGSISINSENIFPIIKKWLYSDKDIFVRELISNGCDAINKFKRLVSIGEAEVSDDVKYVVKVSINEKNKTIKFYDNGIGMTEEEVKKYINQVAFSGAQDFINKYKEKMDEANEIIGHFGLGFYSAFMVSEKVEIETLSYIKDAEAVKWTCDGGTQYKIEPSEKNDRGTVVTLYIDSENQEFLNEYKMKEIINKHCYFLPVEIYVINENEKDKKDEKPEPINDPNPLWLKNPKDCTDEEYIEFYKKVFMDVNDPLFWIHLHVDYPFNLKGILYFPKIRHDFNMNEGQIKLYNNQVFVADNVKEIIPEFLLLLKGVIDCSDLPLNVSRSFLQKDKNVEKISKHITKKVADKLSELYNKEKEKYNEYWNDINPFIKYGCIRDYSFYDKIKDIIIYKDIYGKYITLSEYRENLKDKNKIFYVSDEKQQAQYINLFKEQNLNALILNEMIDDHFISFLEMNIQGINFLRIDAELSDSMKESIITGTESEKEIKEQNQRLQDIFKNVLNNEKLTVRVEELKTLDLPAIMLLAEHSRRMQEISSMYGNMDANTIKPEETLVLNRNNKLIKAILKLDDIGKKDDVATICEHIYDLAMMSHRQLDSETMIKFIKRSNKILSSLVDMKIIA